MGRLPKRVRRIIRNLIATFAWLLLILQVNSVNVCGSCWVAISQLPWLNRYMPLVIFSATVISVVLLKSLDFWKVVLHVLFFPLIILWTIVCILLGEVKRFWSVCCIMYRIATSRTSKFIFLVTVAWSTYMILNGFPDIETKFAMVAVSGYLFVHILKRFVKSFSRSEYKDEPILSFKDIEEDVTPNGTEKSIVRFNVQSNGPITPHPKLINDVLCYSLCRFITRQLDNFHKSRLTALWILIQFACTFALTVFVFALEFYALYRISPKSFDTGQEYHRFPFFLYFSFNTFLGDSTSRFEAIDTASRLLMSIERVISLIIGVALFFIITTVVHDRYLNDVEWLLTRVKNETDAHRSKIELRHGAPISNLIQVVSSETGATANMINWLLGKPNHAK